MRSYYLHHFYKEQPGLNIANSAVREEIRKIIGFWLQLGVSGFRIDAPPFLINPSYALVETPERAFPQFDDGRECSFTYKEG